MLEDIICHEWLNYSYIDLYSVYEFNQLSGFFVKWHINLVGLFIIKGIFV